MVKERFGAIATRLLFMSMVIVFLLNLAVNLYSFHFGGLPIKWGYISLPVIYATLLLSSVNNILTGRIKFNFFLAVLLMIMIIGLQLIWMPDFINDAYRWKLYKSTINDTMFLSLLMFLLGSNIDKVFDLLNDLKYRRISLICLTLFIFFILFTILRTYRLYHQFQIFSANEDDFGVSYISFADNIAVIFIFLCAFSKNKIIEAAWFLSGVIILSTLLSRGSLIAFVFTFVVYYVLRSFKNPGRFLSSMFMLLSSAILLYFLFKGVGFFEDLLKNNRAFSIIYNIIDKKSLSQIYADQSYQYRLEILKYSLSDMKNVWITGSFMHEIDILGPGGYIHNWLSFLVCYGIIPFIMLLFILVKTYIKNIINFIGSDNHFVKFLIVIAFFNLFHIIFDRSYMYYYMWFTIPSMAMLADGVYNIKNF